MAKFGYMKGDISKLTELCYCINCEDSATLMTGAFAYDCDLSDIGLGMWSISPVFKDVDAFYVWAKAQGFAYHSVSKSFVLCRLSS